MIKSYKSTPIFKLSSSIYHGLINFIKVNGRNQSPIQRIEGISIYATGSCISPNISQSIYNGHYERAEIQMLKSCLSKDDIVMEIGAGIGFLSAYCAKKIGSNRIFAYEGNPKLEDVIRTNYQINNVNPTLEICLVGEETRIQDFHITKDFWSSSFVKPILEDIVETIAIPMKSFNDEVHRINPSFLVVDIEGGEYKLFETANLHNIQKIIIELHNSIIGVEKIDFVKNKLSDAGFKITGCIPNCEDEILFLERVNP